MGYAALPWVDTHCHLDAAEFEADRDAVVQRARDVSVQQIVLPAVAPENFGAVRALAHRHGLCYALGLHPLYVRGDPQPALQRLGEALRQWRGDARLVAVGEIGLDFFVPGLERGVQEEAFAAQLALAREHALPVLLHSRRAVDRLLMHLKRAGVRGGIAHAFNGSAQQARACLDLGLRLGFGGAMTHERALQIRRLAAELPADALVLETDAPDIPPQWLYRRAAEREAGGAIGARNEPAELPRIADTLAALRGWSAAETAAMTVANARAALPRLAALLDAGAAA
ncbi:TatD family hydrolase [Azohydromonas aeria]|uniref:TatD family hydrolase n=1 Tax=Azohydromonas aeria TaxID=2590212 RepID=UPI0012F938D5|nr:TatD family hydrolase [Azohydromonas aeria]